MGTAAEARRRAVSAIAGGSLHEHGEPARAVAVYSLTEESVTARAWPIVAERMCARTPMATAAEPWRRAMAAIAGRAEPARRAGSGGGAGVVVR